MRRRPIGQILVEKQEISEADLSAALEEQERTGRRLGEILIESGRTSWLALARAMAEQVLDIQGSSAEAEAEAEAAAEAEPVPVPPAAQPAASPQRPFSTKDLPDPELLVRSMARQVLELHAPTRDTTPPAPSSELPAVPELVDNPEGKLQSVEAMLRERQRAFIELFTTAETLRMKVARLEEILEERDRELTRLRVLRAS